MGTHMAGLYQDSGRARRDSLPSVSLVCSSLADLKAMHKMERDSWAGSVASVDQYARGPGCKRLKVLACFGENRGGCHALAGEACCAWCANSAGSSAMLARLDKVDEKRLMTAGVAAAVSVQQQATLAAWWLQGWPRGPLPLLSSRCCRCSGRLGQSVSQAVPQIKKRRPSGSTIYGAFLPPRPKQQCVAAEAAAASTAAACTVGGLAGGSTAAAQDAQEKQNLACTTTSRSTLWPGQTVARCSTGRPPPPAAARL